MLLDKELETATPAVQQNNQAAPPAPPRRHLQWGWRTWLIAKPFDWVMTPLYLGTALVFFAYFFSDHRQTPAYQWWDALIVIGTLTIFLVADRLEYYFYGENIPNKTAAALFSSRIILTLVLLVVSNFDFSAFYFLIMPVTASFYFGIRAGYWAGIVVWLAGFGVSIYYTSVDGLTNLAENLTIYTVTLVLIVTLTKMVGDERRARRRAENLLAELEASHRRITEMATAEERNRLARDIHDSLGHYLTVVNIQLEKALTFRQEKPQEAEAAVREAKRLASETLQEVRRSVGTLRGSHELFSLEKALRGLLANLDDDFIKANLEIQGLEQGYAKRNLMVLYRVAQEGLTNVQRHAQATALTVRVEFGPDTASLVIRDNGIGFDPTRLILGHGPNGFGLKGLQERLELVGGQFQIESQPGQGTCLTARVPKKSQLRFEPTASPVMRLG